ncbi:MAG: hypothetical protein AB1483_02915 [Candidatus Zixiibacteriota bacterium]
MVEANLDNFTIVILGKWNVAIFNPRWLSEHVFDKPEINVEFPVQPSAPFRITGDGVRIIPHSDRLILGATSDSDSNLEQMEGVACKLLSVLPHTPVSKIGINFGYESDREPERLLGLLSTLESNQLAGSGLKITGRVFGWSFECEDRILNLKCELNDHVAIDFNFHSDIKDSQEAKARIEGKVIQLKNKSRTFIREVFELELEEQ